MVGQIRSYISYISVDSDQSYLDRIKNMIDTIEDDTTRSTLLLEYTNKVNQINIIKKYNSEKVSVEAPIQIEKVEKTDEELVEKVKTFEEEMEEKIREYQAYQNNVSSGTSDGGRTTLLPYIYASAYNLVKIYNMKPKTLRKMESGNKRAKIRVKSNNHGMPLLPIIED